MKFLLYYVNFLVLADGSVFHGTSIGATGHTIAEVVFNTAMTVYQEILTDTSYTKQIVTLTYPHIGNTGANVEDVESSQVYAAGGIMQHIEQAGIHSGDSAYLLQPYSLSPAIQDEIRAQTAETAKALKWSG